MMGVVVVAVVVVVVVVVVAVVAVVVWLVPQKVHQLQPHRRRNTNRVALRPVLRWQCHVGGHSSNHGGSERGVQTIRV